MNHLTEEQFEDIMQARLPEPEHLADCSRCKEVLAGKRAIASRMRRAFASVTPDKQLADNILMQLASKKAVPERSWLAKKWPRNIRFQRIVWPAAAAAVLVITVILGVYVINPPSAMAARAELVKIHRQNLSDNHEFYSEANVEKLAGYFRDKLNFSPSMPVPGEGMAIRGCCVRHFRGRIVGSYVVDTPQGVISVIVVTDKPESLGMGEKFEYQGRPFWKSSFAKCGMVTVRLGNYSYCAVGEVSHEYLTQLLSRLMPERRL